MSLLARTGLDRFNPAQGGVRGMRVVATGLLILMAAIYLTARALEARHPDWGYLRAFAEAAMVGGMADWFAVTALFRHPLGLPIPHTAIIPRNKDRIGDSLASFLRGNFLTPRVVSRRMYRLDAAGAIGRILTSPPKGTRIAEGGSKLAVSVIEAMDDERIGQMTRAWALARMKGFHVAPLAGQLLERAIADGRTKPIIDAIVMWAGRTLAANEAIVRQMIHDRAGSILRWTGLDETLATAILNGLFKLLGEMIDNPEHPLRGKAEEGLRKLAHDLRHDPEMQARVERWKEELLANPAVTGYLDTLWAQAREALLRAARNPDTLLGGRFGETLRGLGEKLQADPRLAAGVNRTVRRATVGAVAAYGDSIVKLVSDTIRGWDAGTVTSRLENAVGRDLQYIRINGTLVGGLVGLTIHVVDRLV
ncbi:DUF445 domain-containing protein [Sphingomonas naphthae]|uniref:DUF445 domain-containing protein n=1 Tax=Sphingomonas naphthae TaxID=1813468 RepID=A0ABY7TQG2_9SPHN|nr:DUF445 domain-containing protein [Sphingomonas naphthae]WCT75231.1 DUF445 domain-containing protein [Sphingomonas naphthae]